MKNKNKFLLGIVTMTAAGVLAACSNSNTGSSSSKQVMNTATSNEISTLDSSKYGDTTSSEALQNSMEGLYHFDKNNRAKLAGATSVKVSNGNRVYTYNLRKNAKWSNGDPITAQDYVTGWRRTVDPKNSSLDSDSYAIIKNGTKITQGKANMQVIQTTSTGVNLFRSGSLDYAPLSSDFVKQYQNNKDYHSQVTPTNGYMTFDLKRKTTGNVHVRRAISQAINKKQLVATVLHAGRPANGIVASNFITDKSTGNDYRKDAGDMVTYNVKNACKEWKIALELLTSDIDDAKRVGEFIQSDLMRNLPGLTINGRSIPLKSRLSNTTNHNYDFVYGTWQPSYEDPLDFLTVGGLFNLEQDYRNRNFWHQIDLVRSTYANDPKQRLQALINAERQMIQRDAFATPLYQAGASYLLKPNVQGFKLSPYGNVAYYWNVKMK